MSVLQRVTSKHELASFLKNERGDTAAIICGRPAEGAPHRQSSVYMDLGALSQVIEHCPNDQVISVESGITISALNELLKGHDQWFPVMPARADTTLLDVINKGDGGPLEHGFPAVRDLILGLEIALTNGDLIKTGGKVVKNVTGYDLTKLFVAARGTLGIPFAAHLRLYAYPEESQSLAVRSADAISLLEQANALIISALPITCLEIFDTSLLSRNDAKGESSDQLISSKTPYCLLVRADGKEEVVQQIVTEIKARLSDELRENATVLERTQSDAAFSQLVDGPDDLRVLEVTASISQCRSILSTFWSACGKPRWQYRPGSGRLRFFSSEPQDVLNLLAQIKERSQAYEPLVVAYRTDGLDYVVERIPAADEAIVAMKKALKARFDPGGRLNPYVSL